MFKLTRSARVAPVLTTVGALALCVAPLTGCGEGSDADDAVQDAADTAAGAAGEAADEAAGAAEEATEEAAEEAGEDDAG